jgi:hypothetical protein
LNPPLEQKQLAEASINTFRDSIASKDKPSHCFLTVPHRKLFWGTSRSLIPSDMNGQPASLG